MSTALKNKRVLILGGSSGIGMATARAAVAAGASVVIASRSEARLAAACDEIGGGVTSAALDTRDFPAVERFFAGTESWDHVAVSAAQTPSGPVRGLGLADARAAMDSKFWGAYHVARAARIAEGGTLTLVSGFLSVRPSAGAVLQGAINAGLEALARGLALELAPMRVNAVSPGMTATPLWNGIDEARRASMFDKAAAHLPVGRVGQAEDMANAILFLMTTPFATGSTVRVDGGGAIAA
jgi:NAD(P)-dependent dehydrogenase (short-subunit alcohol dehydrogenase family)